MKRWFLWTAAVALLVTMVSGCYNSSAPTDTSSAVSITSVPTGTPKESFPAVSPDDGQTSQEEMPASSAAVSSAVEEVEEPSSQESSEEVSETIQYPVGVSRYGKGKLKFTTSVLSLSVVFPEEFCLLNTDYYPSYGIYLKNTDETATLLLESVVDRDMTYRQMADYLKRQYPSAKVSTTDSKEVICKLTMTDEDGHELYIQQKIRVRSGGYHAAVLCCRAEDRTKYERLFNEITFR